MVRTLLLLAAAALLASPAAAAGQLASMVKSGGLIAPATVKGDAAAVAAALAKGEDVNFRTAVLPSLAHHPSLRALLLHPLSPFARMFSSSRRFPTTPNASYRASSHR
jgi:hypothetical protein